MKVRLFAGDLPRSDLSGDFVSIVSTNDLNLACDYAAKLTKPILRLAIAETNNKPAKNASAETPKPTTDSIPPELIASGLKICGKEVFLPKGTSILSHPN